MVPAAAGLAIFALAYDGGGYSLQSRSTVALAVWWSILVAILLRVWPVERVPRAALVTGSLLALFCAWDLVSIAWSASAENAFSEFDRSTLYLGIYLLVVIAVGAGSLEGLIDGLTVGIAVTGIVALVSRLFRGSFSGRGLAALLPGSSTRLSFPLGYWNGLGIFVGLAFPLLFCSALTGGRRRRMLSLAVLPALGAVIYLTSSRGALAAIAGGTLVFVLAQPRRFAALGAAFVATMGCGCSVAVLASRRAIVDGPFGTAAARTDGREAAVAILLICLATAAAAEGAVAVAARRRAPARAVRRGVAALVVGLAVAAFVHEALALRDFTQLPTATTSSLQGNAVSDHLLGGSGSGRWQFWTAALDEFRSAPLAGRGAGSYEAWWAQHGSFRYFVKDAHSLFLQTLAELGIVGFLLLVGALGAGVVVGAARLRAAVGSRQTAIAGLLGAYTAYLIGAGVDWMWELTVVTVAGICVLGLLTGPASLTRRTASEPLRPRRRLPAVAAVAVLACGVLVAQGIVLLAGIEVGASQAAAGEGRLGAARSHALAATRIEPWAATPYLQLALVEESQGDLAAAGAAVAASMRRDQDDWRPWLVASQIETRSGRNAAAARSLARGAGVSGPHRHSSPRPAERRPQSLREGPADAGAAAISTSRPARGLSRRILFPANGRPPRPRCP